MLKSGPGFAVYVHWPFCAQKCPYCDFNSHVRHGGWDERAYRDAYLTELRAASAELSLAPRASPCPSPREERQAGATSSSAPSFEPRSAPGVGPARNADNRLVESIFIGGGTPSLMQPETVAAIIEAVGDTFGLARDCEITLEANPGSVEAGRFRGYREAGVNRVSLGLQALDDDQLHRLGRIHTVAEALAALDIAKATFERVSFDLIYARPGMSEASWRFELARALSLETGHLSLYQLTIEEGTPFAALHKAGKLVVPASDLADQLYEITQDMCEAAGLPAYEISNHARPGEESRHNLVYWRYGHYLGLGPGAHGREPRCEGRVATVNERNPEAWLARVRDAGRGTTEASLLSDEEQADEMLLMGLRLAEGLDLVRLAKVSGCRPSAAAIDRLTDLGMLQQIGATRIRATRSGRFVLNEIVRQLALAFERVATH